MTVEYIPDRYIFEPIEDIQFTVLYGIEKISGTKWWRHIEMLGQVTVDVDNIPFRDRFLEDANA